MFTDDDLVDAIVEQLAPRFAREPGLKPAPPAPKRRIFLTEYEIKKALTPGQKVLTIGQDVILSPLAQEWLALKGIRIVRA